MQKLKIMIIALCGRKGSGKTELSKIIESKYNGSIISFANPLKNLLLEITGLNSIEELNELKNNEKHFKINLNDSFFEKICNKTGISIDLIKKDAEGIEINNIRTALQFIGTNIIRTHNPLWHVNEIEKIIKKFNNELIVIDDCRFYNELKMIERYNSKSYFIIRPILNNVSNHESETNLKWYNFPFDNVIINDITKEELIIEWEKELNNLFENSESKSNIIASNIMHKYDGNPFFLLDYTNQLNNEIYKKLIKNSIINDNKINVSNFRLIKKLLQIDDKSKSLIYNPFIIENIKMYI